MPYRTGARINSHLAGESFDPRPCLDFGFTHYLQGKFLFLNPWDSESDLSVSNMYLYDFQAEKGCTRQKQKGLAEAPRKPRAWWVKVGGAVRVSPFHPTVFCPLKAAWPITAAEIPDIGVTSFACNRETMMKTKSHNVKNSHNKTEAEALFTSTNKQRSTRRLMPSWQLEKLCWHVLMYYRGWLITVVKFKKDSLVRVIESWLEEVKGMEENKRM